MSFSEVAKSTYTALDVAKYVIALHQKESRPISNLRLQKVLYYIQGYSLKKFKTVAFDDDIVNWRYGPVVPSVYYEFCKYARESIPADYSAKRNEIEKQTPDLAELWRGVCRKCYNKSPYDLIEKTHQEDPWKDTHYPDVISTEKIKNFFENNDPLEV